jgi:2-phospho-L-lactate transferase/gluconeogenesis factor (CofD/UPF0052 family)
MKIVMFCGGRGSGTIISALTKTESVELTLLVNGYDDGKSTGLIRRMIPGMLGPSDFRKNISNVMANYPHLYRMSQMMEYRFSHEEIRENIELELKHLVSEIATRFSDDLTASQYNRVNSWLEVVSERLQDFFENDPISFVDMSLGNLIFGGAFLESKSNFNSAVSEVCDVFNLPAKILNITDGEKRILVALANSGNFLENEASIVETRTVDGIAEIFLLEQDLSDSERLLLMGMDFQSKLTFLLERQSVPEINPFAVDAIRSADMVVYGPGTQHSSLLPSYLTKGLGHELSKSSADKILIGNLSEDNDAANENLHTLTMKMRKYLNLNQQSKLILRNFLDHILLSSDKGSYQPWGFAKIEESEIGIYIGQLSGSNGCHDGKRVVNGLMSIALNSERFTSSSSYKRVTIVLPNLNEERTLAKVLETLYFFDWLNFGIIPEFIFVDGGSTDKSVAIASAFPGMKIVSLHANLGRGAAISEGVNRASGDYIITFPTDDEYTPDAIVQVFQMLSQNPSAIVFGTRTTLSVDTNARLKEIYEGNWGAYFLSKWGGFSLTILAGIRWKRWISDPLTGVKGFSRDTKEKLSLEGATLNWDTRLITDSSKIRVPILEVPVNFHPRTKSMGKKVRMSDGLFALLELMKRTI